MGGKMFELSGSERHKRLCLVFFVYLNLCWLLSSCVKGRGEAGENISSQQGFELAKPIIIAIEQFHIENNQYPTHLKELIPEHIEQMPWEDLAEYQFGYLASQGSYEMTFVPEFKQLCSYTPIKRWTCQDQ